MLAARLQGILVRAPIVIETADHGTPDEVGEFVRGEVTDVQPVLYGAGRFAPIGRLINEAGRNRLLRVPDLLQIRVTEQAESRTPAPKPIDVLELVRRE